MLLGCIADDFTGATDLANNLVRNGMRCIQTIGIPQAKLAMDADALLLRLSPGPRRRNKRLTTPLQHSSGCRMRAASSFTLSTAQPSIQPTRAT